MVDHVALAAIGVREGKVAHVRLNREVRLHAITDRMNQALRAAWEEIDSDDEVLCAVISGVGERAFCVGADFAGKHGESGMASGGELTGVGGSLVELHKPLIAAVQGYCLSGGFELAMCADIILAANNALLGLPETSAGIIDHCGVSIAWSGAFRTRSLWA